MAIDVTDATFEADVIERSMHTPVIVDLWAPWCGPCRTIGPILEAATDDTDGKVVLVKVNVDENPAISQAFRVQSIPAVYALSGGQVVDGFVGAQPEHLIREFIAALQAEFDDTALEEAEEAAAAEVIDETVEPEPEAAPADNYDETLTELLTRVKGDDEVRQQFLEILETMGPDDPRTAQYRRKLSTALY
ncbi:MAG: tetratricopeptide repeat protein [Actinomycetota bacterium]|jgi:putative thioredoxin